MSDWFTEHNDWRKQAAMTAVNDLDIEKAVADQASGFVENKLGPLMKGDHPLGFEIVKKNDENTRIVGVFAFKVDKSLLFAPVFFINGEIKGPLLYRCDTKTFVPANKEWAEYLISSQEMKEGEGRDRSRRFENPPLVQMQRIAFLPPGLRKRAAANDENEEVEAKDYAAEFNNSYNKTMEKTLPSIKSKVSDGKTHSIPVAPASGKTRGHARRDGRAHALKMVASIDKKAAADLEKETSGNEAPQKDVPVKEIKVKATKITGKYTVRDMDSNGDKEPETTVGELKVASYDDGSIRLCFTGDYSEEFLTQDGAYDIMHKSATSIQVGGDAAVLDNTAVEQIKSAFLTNVEAADNDAVWDEMLKAADSIGTESHLLKDLLADPVYGEKATEVILKAADANYEFTEQLARLCNGDATQLFSPKIEKKAAAERVDLALVYDQDSMSKQAAVSKEYFRDGFFILDQRPEESMSVIYEDSPSEITAPSAAGEYAILTNDGNLEKGLFVGRRYAGKLGEDATADTNIVAYVDDNPWSEQPADTEYVLIRDKKVKFVRGVMGIFSKEADQCDILTDTVRAGKAYFMLTPSGNSLVGPIAIKSIKDVDGVKYCEAYYEKNFSHARKELWIGDRTKPITINPDVKTNLAEMVIGSETKFIEVDMVPSYSRNTYKTLSSAMSSNDGDSVGDFRCAELKVSVGSTASIDNFIFNRWGIPKVKIEKVMNGDEDTTPKFAIESLGMKSASMNKTCMMVKLARDMNISATKVYDIMEKVATAGSHEFYIQGLNKVAAQLHLVDQPQFDEKFNTEFGVPIEPTKVYHLRTQGIQLFEPPSSIGDAMNPTTATGLPDLTVTTTAPEDLRALADTYSLPHVFDHAAVGTLADTFNAMSLMNRYIPAIEDAVDALGRVKFLLYWMPEDFEKAYGQDDIINLEAQIDTEFSSLGSLLMKLLKKSDAMKKSDGTENSEKEKE